VWSWFWSPFPQPGREPSSPDVVGGGGVCVVGGGVVVVGGGGEVCWTGCAGGAPAGGDDAVVVVGGGDEGVGVGAGVGEGDGDGVGFDFGGGGVDEGPAAGGDDATCDETGMAWACCALTTGRPAACLTTAGCFATVRWCGTMRTMGGAGAFSTRRGDAARRSSGGALASKAARQRYPEVTPAATSRQSRSASNEIRTRISIGLPDDSIGADMPVR
jgi:hypothetical protein